ncbi:isoprenylcysteine carboxylmethyltransferase family protein [Pseudomonas sp. MRSN 12121]|uniref:methyltransferase family protein n=1 Tax=Pseudomonas sp. MRSN 12121 TaxID=1611770 RepID=UPI0005BEA22D|nr:isoprenylcysteine carboxylmethyltransferase family protein [Pseudomonas sp. MRSN 12121]AJO78005.1 isoprenylcysteine carboxyl methyltransferase [Pseudomonas sp. MRSN 12121]
MRTSPKLAAFGLVGTLVYLGLAILGSGGPRAFFSHPALWIIALSLLVMTGVALFSEGNLSPGKREDRDNRWVLAAFGILGLLLAFLPAYTDRLHIWTFGGADVRWLGVVLFIGGGILRLWPVFVLGQRFSGLVAIQPGHRLVTTGIYGTLRNPSYLGLLINCVGWSLAFRSGVGLLLTALMLVPLIARIHAEEALLHKEFGKQYDTYRAYTWRLVPWIY